MGERGYYSSSIPRSASSYVVAAPITLAKSSTTVFTHSPRSYLPPSYYIPPVAPRAGVVGKTPTYSDKYPFVKYSGYSPGAYAVHGPLADSFITSRDHYSQRGLSTTKYLDTNLRLYQTQLRTAPSYTTATSTIPRFSANMDVEDALALYKKRYLTAGQLSKYWLTPRYWENRRDKERKTTGAIITKLGGITHYPNAYTYRHMSTIF